MFSIQVPVRVAAVSMTISGLLVAVATPMHPDILTAPVSEAVETTTNWTALHISYLLSIVLAFVGACGLVAVHRNRLGRLGQAALGCALAGAVGGSAIMALEATAFPILAARDPELLALDGPLLTSPATIGLGVLILGWPLGLALLGVAGARARVFPPAAGILLAVSGPAYLALAGPFVPILGVLSGVALGAAQVWWGWMMWRSTRSLAPEHRQAERNYP
jgi:hypothetical protein